MNLLDRITLEPDKRGGKPCIRGLRITVYDVLEYLASGMTEAEILADLPDLERDDIRAALAFAGGGNRYRTEPRCRGRAWPRPWSRVAGGSVAGT